MNILNITKNILRPYSLIFFLLAFGACTISFAGSKSATIQDTVKVSSSTRTTSAIPPKQSCDTDIAGDNSATPAKSKQRSGYWDIPESEAAKKCLVRFSSIRNQWKSGNIKVIDVRHQQAYQQIHIPGSLNISEYSIRTKNFLKPERLLLVNDGYSYESLLQTCHRLKKSGFKKVSVLVGGINIWSGLGKKLVTNPGFSGYAKDAITSRSLFIAKKEGAWLFLTNVEDIAAIKKLVQSDNVLPLNVKPTVLRARLSKIQKESKLKVPANIVIVTTDGKKTELKKQIAGLNKTNPMLFLQGGLSGYKQYLANHKLQIAKSMRGPVIQKGCGG